MDTTPLPADPSTPPDKAAKKQLHAKLRLTTALNEVLTATGAADDLIADADKTPLTLGLIIQTTQERSFGVLLAFLCLPFLQPIPLPGVSVPFGLAVALLGIQLSLRWHRPWLPQKLLNWRLPPRLGPKFIYYIAKIFRPLEKIIRPRLLFMQNRVAFAAVGVALVIDGILLALPIPPILPLTNTIPAWMALIKILGITEEDGISMIIGTLLTIAATVGLVVAIVLSAGKFTAWWHHLVG